MEDQMGKTAKTDDSGLRIIELRAENIKKLKAIQIRPKGALVEITGPNGAGKTSVLDAIWWTFAGGRVIQEEPLRKGANAGWSRVDLGKYIITRTIQRDDERSPPFTTRIKIETPNGDVMKGGQTLLDTFIGEYTFDPLHFMRQGETAAGQKQQLETLMGFVRDFDFKKVDADIEQLGLQRTAVGRLRDMEQGAAAAIKVPPGASEAEEDISELVSELEQAVAHNEQVNQRAARRHEAAEEVERGESAAERLRAEAASLIAKAEQLEAAAVVLRTKLDRAEGLPALRDIGDLQSRIHTAKDSIEATQLLKRRRTHEHNAIEHKRAWDGLTVQIERRRQDKVDAIANAKLPVAGLGLGEGHITYQGLPFDQASHAEQLRVSLAIAMAINPELKVIRCTDGSLLDSKSHALVEEMAEGRGFQIWVESVAEPGQGRGFEIEDGELAVHKGRK
jgi:DNA repair exonuclease SbcCD ATPase subunit